MLKTLQVSEFSQHINNAIARYKYLNREGLADAESFAELDKVLEQGQKCISKGILPILITYGFITIIYMD